LSKTGLKINYFLSTFKKWANHFISGKQFQKRPNGNPDSRLTINEGRVIG